LPEGMVREAFKAKMMGVLPDTPTEIEIHTCLIAIGAVSYPSSTEKFERDWWPDGTERGGKQYREAIKAIREDGMQNSAIDCVRICRVCDAPNPRARVSLSAC
ncbi:hypothetical protein PFISCL1PPCAC_28432, partial [Pristionchus fissidentatus]